MLKIISHIKIETFIITFILFVALMLRLSVLNKQGELYDEYAVVTNGEIYIGALKNLDFSKEIWEINYEHPPLAKYIYGFATTIERQVPFIQDTFDSEYHPDKRYFLARFTSIIIGLFNIYLIYFIGSKLFNKEIGLISASVLALFPHYISHNTIAGLESLQSLLSTLLVYYGILYFSNRKVRNIYISFICFALIFLTKFTGIFYIFFYILMPFIWDKEYKKDIFRYALKYIKLYASPFIVTLMIVYLSWPFLWTNPLNILKSFNYFSTFHEGEYFMGVKTQPPFYYYFAYISATTPPFILLCAILGTVLGLYSYTNEKKKYLSSIILWFFIPLLASFLGLKQDGLRYIFSFIPALSLLAGIGLYLIIKRFKSILLVSTTLLLFYTSIFWSILKFHPYYIDYYNVFFGGSRKVYDNKLMDFAWWGEGVKESVIYVNKHFDNKKVVVILTPSHTAPLFDEDLEISTNMNEIEDINTDIVIISEIEIERNKNIIPYLNEYKNIYNSEVNGIPLVRVYKR